MSADIRNRTIHSAPIARLRCTISGHVLGANAAFLALMGYESESELRESNPRIQDFLADHDDRARLAGDLIRELPSQEVRWLRRDGSSIWLRVRTGTKRAETRDDVEESVILEVQVEDVTGRHHLEDQLLQAQKMETVGQLAGGMANDLNNLLTGIIAHLDLLEDGLQKGESDRIHQDVEEIRRAATTGSQMVKHLLSFSRGERLRLREVSLEEVTRSSMRRLRSALPDDVQIDMSASAVGPVLADAEAVEQMLATLAANARDAMPEGGRLEIRVGAGGFDQEHLLTTGWGDPGDYGIVTVTDTGRGMSAQTVSRLFEPFFSAREGQDGPGLTMSMVYGMMKQHRGFIEVESEPGEGTTIRLYFRLAASAARDGDDELLQPDLARTAPRILFVEDDENLRRVTVRVLQAHGFEVMEATHGLHALGVMARRGVPDLLITDLVMPSLTGLELVDELERQGKLPPVLLTSGYSPDFLIEEGQPAPQYPFLEKPWSIDALVRKVRELLETSAVEVA